MGAQNTMTTLRTLAGIAVAVWTTTLAFGDEPAIRPPQDSAIMTSAALRSC
jgi:hypothetical protein